MKGDAAIIRYEQLTADGYIIESAALEQIKTHKFGQTSKEYCELELKKKRNGKAVKISIKTNTSNFKKTNDVIAIDENRRDLFKIISQQFSTVKRNTVAVPALI